MIMMDNMYKSIRLGVEDILNTNVTVRRKKKSTSDKKRELFFTIINSIDGLNVRQNILYADLSLDFSNYDEKFYTVIDQLIFMNFGKECADIIAFYLYDRVNIDTSINPLIFDNGEEIIINNPYELWNVLCQINPKLNES
jgi:hypothetical protein